MILKISDVFGVRPFWRQKRNLGRNTAGKISASIGGAKNTASGAFAAVAVRTGEITVKGQLYNFAAKLFFEILPDGVDTLGFCEFL